MDDKIMDSTVSQQVYDPYDYGNENNPTSFWGTVFHLYMICAGPALLSVPKNFYEMGYVYGSLVVCAIFSYHWYAVRTIVHLEYVLCKMKQQPNMSYADMLYHAFDQGPTSIRWLASYCRRTLQILYCVTWIGSLNIVLAALNLQTCLRNAFKLTTSVHGCILLIFLPLLLLTLVHRLRFLVPVSILGNGIVVSCILSLLYYALRDPSSLKMPLPFGDIFSLPKCLASILFVINATGLMLPLKNEMRKPKEFNSTFGVLTCTYIPNAILYVSFNLLCCMKYGYGLRESVIENLPENEPVAQIIIFLFALALVLQQPLLTYVVFDNIWNCILTKDRRKGWPYPVFWEYVARTTVYVVSFAVAFAVPNINVFAMVSGTIGCAVDTMIFPALAETLVMWRIGCSSCKMAFYYLKNGCIILLAIALVVIGFRSCVFELAHMYE